VLCSNSALYTNSLLCFVLYAMLGILGLRPDSQLSSTSILLAALDLTSTWRYLSYRRVDCDNIIASGFYATRIDEKMCAVYSKLRKGGFRVLKLYLA
jgi:hypothetical protein